MARFAIEQYLDQKNQWRKIFGEQPLSLMSSADAQKIADMLDSDLSPENLHCDGEITAAQARTKYNFLTRAASELRALYPNVKFYEFAE